MRTEGPLVRRQCIALAMPSQSSVFLKWQTVFGLHRMLSEPVKFACKTILGAGVKSTQVV